MSDAPVHRLHPVLDRLALTLKGLLTREAVNRQEWIEIQIEICATLVEARDQFAANNEFGSWCNGNGFNNKALNHQTRAAAVAMGRHPEVLRKCLEATDRISLEQIHRFDFARLTYIRKTTRQRKAPKAEVVREEIRSLIEEERPVPRRRLAKQFGVGEATVQRVRNEERGRLEGLHEARSVPPLEFDDMVPTTKQRYETALQVARRSIRAELTTQITAEVHETYDAYIKFYNDKIVSADAILNSFKGLMTRADFRKIKACLHPDHNTFTFAAEALQLFSSLESVLVKPDQPIASGPKLPSTAADLLSRRKTWKN